MVISPLALITVFVAGCVTWTRPSYGAVQYPEWAHIIGQYPVTAPCLLTTLPRLAAVLALRGPDPRVAGDHDPGLGDGGRLRLLAHLQTNPVLDRAERGK